MEQVNDNGEHCKVDEGDDGELHEDDNGEQHEHNNNMQRLSRTFLLIGPTRRKTCTRVELITKVKSVNHECWRAGENNELGKVKNSAAGVYDRLKEMQLQKTIRLSELPLPGKILVVYKGIGSKPQAPSAGSYKRGRPLSNADISGRKKAIRCA